MNAKDTVMKQKTIDQLAHIYSSDDADSENNIRVALCKNQADISFKAGIKEVVTWIKENEDKGWGETLIVLNKFSWEAKLKEWGV